MDKIYSSTEKDEILRNAFNKLASKGISSNWYDVPEEIRSITARGWFLGRWIPTFLIIDGPIGRFICKGGSPLFEKLKINIKHIHF